MNCPRCGNNINEGARFCTRCGAPVQAAQAAPQQVQNQAAQPQYAQQQYAPPAQQQYTQQPPPQPAPQQAVNQAANYVQQAAQQVSNVFRFQAPAASGEVLLGGIQTGFAGAAAGAAGGAASALSGAIQGPGQTIGAGFKSFFSSIAGGFKNPKTLIPAIVLAVVWLVLNILQACGINPLPTRALSFLTFADGGMHGGVVGAIGGIIGKGVFAAAVTTLIGMIGRKGTAPKRSFGDIIKGSLGVSMDTLWGYLTGIGAAMLLFLFISGGDTRISFMGGLAASFMAGRSALNNGFVQRLIASFSSKGRSQASPGAAGLMRGLSAGFAAAAVIGLLNINLILIILGSLLLVGGAVMMILQATGVVRMGKGAQTA